MSDLAATLDAQVDALDKLLSSKQEPASPVPRSCWNCDKLEEPGDKFFYCPECRDYGLIPAPFCSKTCYRSSWSRHKQWHVEATAEMQESRLVAPTNGEAAFRKLERRSYYVALIAASISSMYSADFYRAMKHLEKAKSRDPRRPEAYFDLGTCFLVMQQRIEAISCFRQACERYALVELTGYLGDNKIEEDCQPSWAMDSWSTK
jgi:tetratricopeptide (TPR) repeat protein